MEKQYRQMPEPTPTALPHCQYFELRLKDGQSVQQIMQALSAFMTPGCAV